MVTSTGWATDLKTVPENMIASRVLRTGDGSHRLSKKGAKRKEMLNQEEEDNHDGKNFWGFGEKKLIKNAKSLNNSKAAL